MEKFRAGFGKAEVQYTEEMLPTFGENYNQIHDKPYVKVLFVESEPKLAFVTIGVVMGEREVYERKAAQFLEINVENVIIHIQHILATPHFDLADNVNEWKKNHKEKITDKEAEIYYERDKKIAAAYEMALKMACVEAKENVKDAQIGIGNIQANINVNRVVNTVNGWWQGVNQEGATDHTVQVISVKDMDKHIMGVIYTVNVAPGCMEFSMINGGRSISGDLAGESERYVEKELGNNSVAMYATGITGDQWQLLRARLDYINRAGHQIIEDLGESGFMFVKLLGTRLGEQVVKCVDNIEYKQVINTKLRKKAFLYIHQNVKGVSFGRPSKICEYEIGGKENADVIMWNIDGRNVVLFCGTEMNVATLWEIKDKAPYENVWIIEFSTRGGGYMPPADFYDKITFQSTKCRYAKGTAEQFAGDVINLLMEEKRNDN